MRLELGRGELKLWAMHRRAFDALRAAGTQWRTRLMVTDQGLRELVIGLDYAGVGVALDMLGLQLTPNEWAQLRVLERAAAASFNGSAA